MTVQTWKMINVETVPVGERNVIFKKYQCKSHSYFTDRYLC
ncbi:MAG: hypothetical protein SCABRO_02188 [Candidatus Scalindua brodae]|uniref:Uncharacterized protein n=1 Tax=Candidatus Scalindua brodae TaxID=237368 RepID=A0A0B0EJ64_9BACT|nr:MAG: hypothetical protein SCABRO_02188 [Candidatus Scalindua brodae]